MTIAGPWADPLLVDRSAHLRDVIEPVAASAVLVSQGSVLMKAGELVFLEPGVAPLGGLWVYLGREERAAGTRDVIAIEWTQGATQAPAADAVDAGLFGPASAAASPLEALAGAGAAFVGLRDALGALGARDRELAATAVALVTWNRNHPRCPLCGDRTSLRKGGWVRWCERDQKEHYPRTDPAIIVAITDASDRLLIAHAAYWSERRFSHLAGYLEPGESFEQAVHREVAEEAGLELRDLRYLASQPWPFPASMMVAFTAVATGTELHLDQEEITEARWVTRQELAELIAAQEVIPPPVGSIARQLMESWFGSALPGPSSEPFGG